MSRLEDISLKQLGEQPHSDMDVNQRDRVVQLCKQAFDQYEKSTERGKEEREAALVSKYLKELLDLNLGPNWMVIVGQAYSAQFTCASKSYWCVVQGPCGDTFCEIGCRGGSCRVLSFGPVWCSLGVLCLDRAANPAA